MKTGTKITLGIIGIALLLGWMKFASRHNGKPAFVPPDKNNPADDQLQPGKPE